MYTLLVGVLLGGGLLWLLMLAVRRPEYGIYGGFLLSGVLLSPDVPHIGPKLALPDLPLVLALIGTLVAATIRGVRSTAISASMKVAVAVGTLFLYTAAASIGINVIRGKIDVWNSTIDLINYCYGFSIFLVTVLVINSWQKWRICLVAWMLGVGIVAAVAIAALLGLAPEWAYHKGGSRVSSTFRNVNQLHSYVAPVVPLLVWVVMRGSFGSVGRIMAGALAIGCIVALSLTGSRTAIVLVATGLLGVMILALRDVGSRPLAWVMVLGVIVTTSYVMGYYATQVSMFGEAAFPERAKAVARPFMLMQQANRAEELLGARAEQIELVSRSWVQHPILGVGPGNVQTALNFHREVHNTYLGVLIEQGVIGLGSLVMFLGIVFYGGWRAFRGYGVNPERDLVGVLLIGFVVVCAYGMASFGIRQRAFWLITALVMCAAEISRRRMRLEAGIKKS